MTIGRRRSLCNTAQAFKDLGPAKREASLLMQRSNFGPDILAALIGEDLDSAEIARTARKVLSGDFSAAERFSRFDVRTLQSICRLLCLVGDDDAFDKGLDILLAMDVVPNTRNIKPYYQRLRIESLVFRRRFTEAADYLREAEVAPGQRSRYRLGIHNPFRNGNPQAIPPTEWLKMFNEYVDPDSSPNAISLDPSLGDYPFDQLWSAPKSAVDGPLVTVVMSSYRRDDTILGAVHSVLNQTWKSLELIIIDDDSGPEYQHIYELLESLDPRVRVVRQRINGGTYLIRNRAITLSRGDFITFQDSDDWSHPRRIERQVKALLEDRSIVATQSHCVRTDDFLDPVQVGYPKALRRNESSLMFRAEMVRRVGFFHYTRKGGDSEYRLRLESAYGRPTPLIGDYPLALVRLTPGSLSRNEFAPGFRHPSRLVYSQGFELVHSRAKIDDSHYRPLAEYEDRFVPARFRPRSLDLSRDVLDVVLVADLRTCAEMVSPVIDNIARLRRAGLRVGIAHVAGIYASELSVNRIEPEMSAVLVDGYAEPVLFGEDRTARTVLAMDARLLQYLPWGAGRWHVDRVVVPRTGASPEDRQYDETTVALNCLRLFGNRPDWIEVSGDEPFGSDELFESVEGVAKAKRPILRPADLDLHCSARAGANVDTGTWRLQLRQLKDCYSGISAVIGRQLPEVPVAVACDSGGVWCAVIGWPNYGFDSSADMKGIAEGLLLSWQQSTGGFDKYYAEIGGDCLVVRFDGQAFAVRSTIRKVVGWLDGSSVAIESSRVPSAADLIDGNRSELIVDLDGTVYRNPIDVVIRYDGSALEEYRQLIDWEIGCNVDSSQMLQVSDDFASAVWIGLLRDRIDESKISVSFDGSRVARFLRRHMIAYTVTSGRRAVLPNVFRHAEAQTEHTSLNGLTAIGSSLRARTLGQIIGNSMTPKQILESMWAGLSEVVEDPLIRREAERETPQVKSSKDKLWLTDEVQDARNVYSLPLERRRVHRIGINADLSLNERFPLSGLFIRGKSNRLVVTIAENRVLEQSGYPTVSDVSSVFPDHNLIAVDTTFNREPSLDFGWMFGSSGDNIARRWSILVKQLSRRLGCSSIVVRGEGRAGIPAVLLASYLPKATALVENIEATGGESDPSSIAQLADLDGYGDGREGACELLRSHEDRLDVRRIVRASGPRLKVVLCSVPSREASWRFELFDEAGCDVVAYSDRAENWLQKTGGASPHSYENSHFITERK